MRLLRKKVQSEKRMGSGRGLTTLNVIIRQRRSTRQRRLRRGQTGLWRPQTGCFGGGRSQQIVLERSKQRRCQSVSQVTEVPGDPNRCSCGRVGGVGTERWGKGEPKCRQLKNDWKVRKRLTGSCSQPLRTSGREQKDTLATRGVFIFVCFVFYNGNDGNMFNVNTDEKENILHVCEGQERAWGGGRGNPHQRFLFALCNREQD